MRKQTKTEKIIEGMLKESTGRHMLDSGGFGGKHGYGRHWERNQVKNFQEEQETIFYVSNGCFYITHNLYHWLSERLIYSAEWQRKFTRFASRQDQKEESWLAVMENFVDYLKTKYEIGGIYGEGEPLVINTYNGEDCLSQTLQYIYLTVDNEPLIILQIHGGCDVRGGYTAPKCFTESGCFELGILDNARVSLYCQAKNEPHSWYTDDSYHFYGSNSKPDLKDMELIDFTDEENDYNFSIEKDKAGNIINVFLEERIIDSPLKSFKGKVFSEIPIKELDVIPYDGETGKAYCPICGMELLASSY